MDTRYNSLPWVVEVRYSPSSPVWEPIVAFNVEHIARDYADGCQRAANRDDLSMRYRVVEVLPPIIQPVAVMWEGHK
jgi:hypothetical protein